MQNEGANNTSRIAHEVKIHHTLVELLARTLRDEKFLDVRAYLPGWKPGLPYRFSEYTPDVTCFDQNKNLFIFEVETKSTLYDEHTKRQLTAFSSVPGKCIILFPVKDANSTDAKFTIDLVKVSLTTWGLRGKVFPGIYDLTTREFYFNL